MCAVRSAPGMILEPYTFHSSDRVKAFFDTVLKVTLGDLGLRMEGYCVSGIQGMKSASMSSSSHSYSNIYFTQVPPMLERRRLLSSEGRSLR